MPIAFRCPQCRNKLSIAKRKAGTLVSCPGCAVEVRVPTAADVIDPQVQRLLATAGSEAGHRAENLPELEEAPPPMPASPQPVKRTVKPAPAPVLSSQREEPPLFEREDFAELLEKGGDADEDETPLPLPPDPSPKASQPDGFVITRGMAVMVLISVIVLLGGAFAVGFLVGHRG